LRLAGQDRRGNELGDVILGRKLKPGRYRLVATPTAGGIKGKATSSGFRIVR
jgi:hypothetical protein